MCLNLLPLASVTAVIQTQQTVLAAVGEEASLNCQLLETKDVVQVTWQKISPEKKNLATYSKYSGQWVNSDKIEWTLEFKETGLQSSAIIVRNVTQQDEGCYSCLFNTDPDGALIGRTCLQLYGKDLSKLQF
uniref:Ig-like domain-containing protein n=1 Tax=Monopterus albus TaxID=43700 RepID=A0A3Q3JQL9_MONAL